MKHFRTSKSFVPLKKLRRTKPRQSITTLVRRTLENSEEKKYNEVAGSGVDMPNTGTVAVINEIGEGTDFNQRVGRKVRNKYLYYDISVQPSTAIAVAGTSLNATWHLVWDRTPSGSSAAYGNIFDTTVISPTQAFKNVGTFQDRFKILKTETFLTGTAVNGLGYRRQGWIPFEKAESRDQMTQFASSAVAVPNTGALYLCFASTEGAANQMMINYGIRIVYVDM